MKIISDKENWYFLDGEKQGCFYLANKVRYIPQYAFDYYGNRKPIKKEQDLWEKGYLFYIQYSSYDIFDHKTTHYKKYGYAFDSGEVIIPPRYDVLMFWGSGFKARKYIDNIREVVQVECLLDKFGNFVLPDYISKELILKKNPSFKDIHVIGAFSYGFAIFCSYNKLGVINKNLEIVIPAQYCCVNKNKNGFEHGQFSFNTYEGEYRGIIELGYIEQNGLRKGNSVKKKFALIRGYNVINYIEGVDYVSCLNNGLGYRVFKGEEQGLYDINGNVLILCGLHNICDIGTNIYLFKKDNKSYLLRFDNNVLVAKSDFDFEFINSDYWDENLYGAKVCVKIVNEYLILDKDFKIIDKIKNLDSKFHPDVKTYGQGLIGCYRKTSLSYYFFNLNGDLIIPNKENVISLRSIVSCFNENKLAKVELDHRDSRGWTVLDGYYTAIIDISGKVKESEWIPCDLRDPSWLREDYYDNSDAFEGDPDAYWNID